MGEAAKFFVVKQKAVPEVLLKVVEAKRLLDTGKVTTVNEAARVTGIIRSAFYKYRDAVQPFRNMNTSRVITFQFLLHDEAGMLSGLLTLFAKEHANILTINSIVPTNGCAVVTISAETMDLTVQLEELLRQIHWMHDMGIGGFFMHARGGLQTPYMEDEWFENVTASVEMAEELGMNAWAYDENGWPSGFAGGKLLEEYLSYGREYYAAHLIYIKNYGDITMYNL